MLKNTDYLSLNSLKGDVTHFKGHPSAFKSKAFKPRPWKPGRDIAKDARKCIEKASAREDIFGQLNRCRLCKLHKIVVLRRDVMCIHYRHNDSGSNSEVAKIYDCTCMGSNDTYLW